MKKKLLAIILAAITIFGCTFSTFATEADDSTEQGVICEYFYWSDVIVICYCDIYSEIGNEVTVSLGCIDWDGVEFSVTVGSDGISEKIYEHDGKNYPQIFIKVPYDDNIFDVTSVEITEGAFCDDNGNYSKKVKCPIDDSTNYGSLEVYCKGLESMRAENVLEIISESSVVLSYELDSIFSEVWREDIVLSIESETEKIELNSDTGYLKETGDYTASVSINDFLTSQKYITVLSKSKAYFTSLGKSLKNVITSPIILVYSLFYGIFVPGPGTLIGGLGLLGSLAAIPQFFIALFAGPITETLEI